MNNAAVEIAIDDFLHSKNIADQVVESLRFAHLLRLACTVGDDFKLPSRTGGLRDMTRREATIYENSELMEVTK